MNVRSGYRCKPWYLITTESVETSQQARQIIFAYARRWQIEMSLRFTKSELIFESPPACSPGNPAYAFLLSLLTDTDLLFHFISRYCHRTGKWSRTSSTPLYRLRLALVQRVARLSPAFPPFPNFGVRHVS